MKLFQSKFFSGNNSIVHNIVVVNLYSHTDKYAIKSIWYDSIACHLHCSRTMQQLSTQKHYSDQMLHISFLKCGWIQWN